MFLFNKYSSLFFYGLLICVAHILWFNLVPLMTLVQTQYQVDESLALLSIAVFPIFYVLLSLHAGKIIDKYKYTNVIIISALLMSSFALLRFYAINFWLLLLLQCAIAICQPYLINAISKFVADWFSKKHVALVTSVLTMNMFLGMAIGAAITPVAVSSLGFDKTMLGMGVISFVSTVLFILFANVNAKHKNTDNQQVSFLDYKTLAKKPNIRPLLYFAFLSLGAFNALTTWRESIYLEYGLTLEEAGMLTGVLIIGGIFGSPILSTLSDKTQNRTVFLYTCTFLAALLIYPLCQSLPINSLMLLAFITGFIFLPGLPILLAEAESQVSIEQTGIVASFVLWVGNLGAFILIALTSFASSLTTNWQTSVVLMMCTLLLACILLYKTKPKLALSPQ